MITDHKGLWSGRPSLGPDRLFGEKDGIAPGEIAIVPIHIEWENSNATGPDALIRYSVEVYGQYTDGPRWWEDYVGLGCFDIRGEPVRAAGCSKRFSGGLREEHTPISPQIP